MKIIAGGSIGIRRMEWSGNEKRALIKDGNPKALKRVSTAIIAEKGGNVK